MIHSKQNRVRRGIVLPLLAISMVGLMSFVALAIDIGVMAVARNQAQDAADGAALAGARTLNGMSSQTYNYTAAVAMAKSVAESNAILANNITLAQVTTCQAGIYQYSSTAGRFQALFGTTPSGTQSYGLIQVGLTTSQQTTFANVMGISSMSVTAIATAVHRPRDIAVVLDFSGSMGYSTQINYDGSSGVQSLNPDASFPQFGPYSVFAGSGMVLDPNNPGTAPTSYSTYTPTTPMQRVWPYVDSSGYEYSPCNLSMETSNGPAVAGNFLLSDQVTNAFVNSGSFPTFTNVNVSGASNPTNVVTPAPSTFVSDSVSGFVGDSFPLKYGTPTASTGGKTAISATSTPTPTQYAQCVADIFGVTRPSSSTYNTVCPAWEANGYDATYTSISGPTSGIITATATVKSASQKYQGFTMGPGYWGKTFYMWPPDPRTPVSTIGGAGYVAGDWRQRFFLPRTGSTQSMQDDSVFWSSSGKWNGQNPGSSAAYIPNYNAILAWIASGPQTLPASLCSGRVVYYSTIPTSISVSQSTGLISSGASNDATFWKEYIDYVLGSGQYTASSSMYGAQSANSNTGGGSTLYYNSTNTNLSPQITARSNLLTANNISGATNATPIVITTPAAHGLGAVGTTANLTIAGVKGNTAANGTWTVTVVSTTTFSLNTSKGNGTYTSGSGAIVPDVMYSDTPVHPRMQFWFGPLSMMGFMQDTQAAGGWNWRPGTCYEAQSWQLKVGINASLIDIQNNHPNDIASVIFYSGLNQFNTARVSMGKDFSDMQNCLFFPYSLLSELSTASNTYTPFSTGAGSNSNPSGITDVSQGVLPVAGSSTCPWMGLMIAYNQFGNATDTSVSPSTTYVGRQTASKIVILETDGCPNTTCSGTLTGSGAAGNWYYKSIGSADDSQGSASDMESLNVTSKTGALTVVQQIAASTTASTPGYSTTRNPAYVHAVAFGDLFESSSTSPLTTPALQFLTAVQIYGNTSTYPSGGATTPGTMGTWYTSSLSASTYYTTPQPWKVITGSYTTRINLISQCMQLIMQGGVQVVLIQ